MPSVFITQTGRKYHARTDLECLAKAQGFFSVDLATASDGGLRPCIGCDAPGLPGVTEGDSQWLRRIDEWSESRKFDSLWEQVFSVRVLAKTPNITVDDVEIQSYVNAGENTYKVDFLISKARLVIEVDGFQKNNAPPSPTDQEQRRSREITERLAMLSEEELELLATGSSAERGHLLWVAACRRYRLIGEFAEEVLRERFLTMANTLEYADFDTFLRGKAMWHTEIDELTDLTTRKLRSNLFRMMVASGLLSVKGRISPTLLSSRLASLLGERLPSDIRFFPARPMAESW